MSKAFTKEDDGGDALLLFRRVPLPEGVPNYVTRRGMQLLRDELAGMEAAERARLQVRRDADTPEGDARRLAVSTARQNELKERIASARVVDPPRGSPPTTVRFGTVVTVRGAADALHRYGIVGVDEANAAAGRLAFTSPMARALLGRQVGDVATVRSARADEEWEIVAIALDDGP